jgi:hypothetical protein
MIYMEISPPAGPVSSPGEFFNRLLRLKFALNLIFWVGQPLSNRRRHHRVMKNEKTENETVEEVRNTPAENFDRAMAMLTNMAAETAASKKLAGAVSEMAADWLTPHYLLALRDRLAAETDGPARFKLLRKAARDVVTFQRSGLSAARLQLDREKLELKRQQQQAAAAETERLDPNREWTDAEMKACVDKVDEIMGLKPTKQEEAQEAAAKAQQAAEQAAKQPAAQPEKSQPGPFGGHLRMASRRMDTRRTGHRRSKLRRAKKFLDLRPPESE